MTEYTPTTEELADVAEHLRLTTVLNMTEAAEVAPLWLAAHDRAVKAEALREAADMLNFAPATDTRDPLEAEVRQIKMLRVRADEIEATDD